VRRPSTVRSFITDGSFQHQLSPQMIEEFTIS